jgi:hypothetical protein
MANHIERRKFLTRLGGAADCVAARGARAAADDAGNRIPRKLGACRTHAESWLLLLIDEACILRADKLRAHKMKAPPNGGAKGRDLA